MSSLFTPDVPQQDPAIAKQQRDEQARAESARIGAVQEQMQKETVLRGTRSTGIRSLLGSFGSGTSLLGSS